MAEQGNPRPTIAIIGGTGDLGFGLAGRWAAAGYPVVLGSRAKEKAIAAAQATLAGNGAAAVTGDDNLGAARAADVVVIAHVGGLPLEELLPGLLGFGAALTYARLVLNSRRR